MGIAPSWAWLHSDHWLCFSSDGEAEGPPVSILASGKTARHSAPMTSGV